MENNFNVNGFLKTLEQNQPKPREMKEKERTLEKLYLSYPGNYGKYQIFPMNSVVTGMPFDYLNDTREVKIPRKNVLADGTENVYEAWIKILPSEAYRMLDKEGRVVSSLTTEDENLLIQAKTVFDQLYLALGGNQKDQALNKAVGYLRKRNYTVFHGKCLNKWTLADPRTPERTGFASLFVCSAKGFSGAIEENISDGMISHGGDSQWLGQIYNRDLVGRGGYLIFSISMGVNGKVGYSISTTHESDRYQYLKDFVITEEEAALMQDPIETFLGWQGSKEQEGRLFNRPLMEETIGYMSEQLAAVRMALSTGVDVQQAMASTSEEALKHQGQVRYSNDPMLSQGNTAGGQTFSNPGAIRENNNSPYSTPPAAHIDPVTMSPDNSNAQHSPFAQPSFAKPAFGGNSGTNPNPFSDGNVSGDMNNPFK